MKRRTVYATPQRYMKYGLTTDLPRSGRPVKLSNRKLATLVRKVNNKVRVWGWVSHPHLTLKLKTSQDRSN